MDYLSSIGIFVAVVETRSFTEAAKSFDISGSAVGKCIARMEERLGVRLFHRSTRSITLTAEGAMFLKRCRRILGEMEAAKAELSQMSAAPRGKLRISVPLLDEQIMPVLVKFMTAFPDIELDIDMSDRKVEVIEEGFDAVIRTGEPLDSRLTSKALGTYKLVLVAAPSYLETRGRPTHPNELEHHYGIFHRFPANGRVEQWPLYLEENTSVPTPVTVATCTTTQAQYYLAKQGNGIACLPDFVVRGAVESRELEVILNDFMAHSATVWTLWPASRHGSPKVRVFVDFVKAHLFPSPNKDALN
jgi:DNA-binding transcriptional LysR family regulator